MLRGVRTMDEEQTRERGVDLCDVDWCDVELCDVDWSDVD